MCVKSRAVANFDCFWSLGLGSGLYKTMLLGWKASIDSSSSIESYSFLEIVLFYGDGNEALA